MSSGEVAAIVLAGTSKVARRIWFKRRAGIIGRVLGWRGDSRGLLENRITSWVNRDDYIYGENKALLYLHPELVYDRNMAFFKRTINLARRTGDRLYRMRRDDLLHYLAMEGQSSLGIILDKLSRARSIDQENVVIVGPEGPIRGELSDRRLEGWNVARQGSSLGENIVIGKEALSSRGRKKEYILVMGADTPLMAPEHIDSFIEGCMEAEGGMDIYYGMSLREELGPILEMYGVGDMGLPGPNRPARGNIKKFGFPFIDDQGLCGRRSERVHLMNANVFLYRESSFDRSFIDKQYSMRKMFSNPFIYPSLLATYGPTIFRFIRGRLTLTEGERIYRKNLGTMLKVVKAHPLFALDIDSFTDLRRASAIHFGTSRDEVDIEVDFKEYAKRKRSERRARRNGGH